MDQLNPQASPAVISERNYPIQGRWILKYFISSLFGSIIAVIYIAARTPLADSSERFFVTIFYLVIFGIIVALNVGVATLRRSRFHYTIGEKFLTLRQGVLSKQQRDIPYGV